MHHDPGGLQICQVENYTIFAEMHVLMWNIIEVAKNIEHM